MHQIQHWLELISALLVFAMGGWMLQARLHDWRHERDHALGIEHNHNHHHHHDHSHDIPLGKRLSFKELFYFGLAGGMIPCPTALAIFILGVGMGKPVLGLVTVIFFSVGVSVALVGVGIAVCRGIDLFQSKFHLANWGRWLPIASSAVVMALGAIMLAAVLSGHGHSH